MREYLAASPNLSGEGCAASRPHAWHAGIEKPRAPLVLCALCIFPTQLNKFDIIPDCCEKTKLV